MVIIMAFPKSRILSTQQLIQQIIESNRNGERFCFILGSGTSVESGIPSGNKLEMKWMNCIMGVDNDEETPPMDTAVIRKFASYLYEEGEIEHRFDEIEAAWIEAKEKNKYISSKYYFDIYKLRFYPNQRNGYRYLERVMESHEPSIGYHTLALMLTKEPCVREDDEARENNRNNLVITTNFDSLIEDALFLYTTKKPLIVSHESLADYIESDIQRPIIAKIHRGLMYAPFNSPETTMKLKEEWRDALNYAFSTYTPIVIGYGGGDHSLMSFLEEESTRMRHGMYWCYRTASNLPGRDIQKLVREKNGYFVTIDGFDALMIRIGISLYPNDIPRSRTEAYFRGQNDQRIQLYNDQWDNLIKNPELKPVLQPLNDVELLEEEKRKNADALTVWDYMRRGDQAFNDEHYEDAINAYTAAISLNPDSAIAYSNRGSTYNRITQYEKAIEDCSKAIELDPNYSRAFNNRGFAYRHLKQYEKAIRDYNKAIDLNPNYAIAFSNRGHAYSSIGEYGKAIEDCSKAIELDPNYSSAFINRGSIYEHLEQYDKAIKDLNKAIDLDPNKAVAYVKRGSAYNNIEQYEKAVEDCSKAIDLNPNNAHAFNNRGFAYSQLEQYEKAIDDYTKAIALNPKYKSAYYNRARAYRAIGKETLAKADEDIALTL